MSIQTDQKVWEIWTFGTLFDNYLALNSDFFPITVCSREVGHNLEKQKKQGNRKNSSIPATTYTNNSTFHKFLKSNFNILLSSRKPFLSVWVVLKRKYYFKYILILYFFQRLKCKLYLTECTTSKMKRRHTNL